MMEKSIEEFHGHSLVDEILTCTSAEGSLLDILANLSDEDLSANISTLAAVAHRDVVEKVDAIVSIIDEFVGQIEIDGLAGGKSTGEIKQLRFKPCQRLVSAIGATTEPGNYITIGIPGGWEKWSKKGKNV